MFIYNLLVDTAEFDGPSTSSQTANLNDSVISISSTDSMAEVEDLSHSFISYLS